MTPQPRLLHHLKLLQRHQQLQPQYLHNMLLLRQQHQLQPPCNRLLRMQVLQLLRIPLVEVVAAAACQLVIHRKGTKLQLLSLYSQRARQVALQ